MRQPTWYPNADGKCSGSFKTVRVGHGRVEQTADGKVKVECPSCGRIVGLRSKTPLKRVIAQHMRKPAPPTPPPPAPKAEVAWTSLGKATGRVETLMWRYLAAGDIAYTSQGGRKSERFRPKASLQS